MSLDHQLVLDTFFSEWEDRDRQEAILKEATDNTLIALVLITQDIRASVLAEHDRRKNA